MSTINRAAKFAQNFGRTFLESRVGQIVSPGPLELFKKEQFKKLEALVDQQGIGNIARDIGSNYFKGANIRSLGDKAIEYTAADASRGAYRKGIAGAGLGLLAANALDVDAFGATDQANNIASLGANTVLGTTLYQMGGTARAAGIGYLAATAINTFRDGDNLGPQ